MAPARGVPPSAPDGYEQVPGDPFLFMIALEKCSHRTHKIEIKSCCGKVVKPFCIKRNVTITRLECRGCKLTSSSL